MKPVLRAGVVLGVLCVFWMFVMGFTGWYKDPALLNLFFLVILIELGVLVWGLRQTAAERNYFGQVLAGLAIAGVASVIIFAGSMLFTSVLFPNYFDEMRVLQAAQLKAAGMPEDQIRAALDAARPLQTPLVNALSGVVGTMLTGLVASLVIAIFARKRG